MLRRATLVASFLGAFGTLSPRAWAAGAWIAGASLTPTEQRVAVASGPARTTLWTSLRFDAAGGPVGIVVPAPPGASLDFSSDAWFEALEVATAPRIFPPSGVSPFCSGKSGSPSVFEIAGPISHTKSLAPQGVTVLDDAAAVSTWAGQANLAIPPKLAAALMALSGVRFVAILFNAPPGSGVTPTLRVSTAGPQAMLPLALTSAGAGDLHVTAWMIGQGEADLIGDVKVATSASSLVWKAGAQASNYDALRDTALASGTDTFLVEAAGHQPLVQSIPIAQGTAFIDGVVTTFFERAAAYGDGAFDAPSCIGVAKPKLDEATSAVAAVCPRAALGVIAPAPTCTESPGPGEIDPNTLRCGSGADDLALALSGLVPASAWLTRQSLIIPGGSYGADTLLGFAVGAPASPVLDAANVDVSDCGDAGGHPGSSSSSSSTSGMTTSGSSGRSSSGIVGFGDGLDITANVVGAAASGADTSCDCSGTQGTSGGGCSGSTDASGSTSSDSCSGSSSSSDGTSSSGSCSGSSSSDGTSSESCSSGSSSSDSCSSGSSSSESCSSGSSDSSGCSGSSGDAFKCATAGSRRPRGPRLSIVLMAAMAVLAPLRRRARPRRSGRH
jgi:hypothetical protein